MVRTVSEMVLEKSDPRIEESGKYFVNLIRLSKYHKTVGNVKFFNDLVADRKKFSQKELRFSFPCALCPEISMFPDILIKDQQVLSASF